MGAAFSLPNQVQIKIIYEQNTTADDIISGKQDTFNNKISKLIKQSRINKTKIEYDNLRYHSMHGNSLSYSFDTTNDSYNLIQACKKTIQSPSGTMQKMYPEISEIIYNGIKLYER